MQKNTHFPPSSNPRFNIQSPFLKYEQLDESKVQQKFEKLMHNRQEYYDNLAEKQKREMEAELKEDPQIFQEQKIRQKKQKENKARMAQFDFERQRDRLFEERHSYQKVASQYELVQKNLQNIQMRSKIVEQEQNRMLSQLTNRKKIVCELLEKSRQRWAYHLRKEKRFM